MTISRKLINVYTPPTQPGFLGTGHSAHPVIQVDFPESDPFILLMDDRLHKQDEQPVGGPHPHAGFETVTLVLEGELGNGAHRMKGGDLQLMTAGSGVIHTETIDKKASMRILQLWLNLPKKDRWAKPRVQDIASESVPTVSDNGVEIKVYSGSLAGVSSPIQNHTPLLIADIRLQPGTTTLQHIPASYTAFLYPIEGNVQIGEENARLRKDQVGWLDKYSEDIVSELKLTAGETGGRVILYAGEPQKDQIVSHGPFIGDTPEDIRRLYQQYRQGNMQHITTVPEAQQLHW